ncbi:MAG: hypothetical protein HYT89_05135 [Candidatus Omnitrophica bacterium]|nr:hypothetical protein [Candidatus Omnitrophota bacterium]
MNAVKSHAVAGLTAGVLFGLAALCHAEEPEYLEFHQESEGIRLTGRIYHLPGGKFFVEAWPQPWTARLEIDKISLTSPSGNEYRSKELQNHPLRKIAESREKYAPSSPRENKARQNKVADWLVPDAHATCSPGHAAGSDKDDAADEARDRRTRAAFGRLMSVAKVSDKDWVAVGEIDAPEEPGRWKANVMVVDKRGAKRPFTIPFGYPMPKGPASGNGTTTAGGPSGKPASSPKTPKPATPKGPRGGGPAGPAGPHTPGPSPSPGPSGPIGETPGPPPSAPLDPHGPSGGVTETPKSPPPAGPTTGEPPGPSTGPESPAPGPGASPSSPEPSPLPPPPSPPPSTPGGEPGAPPPPGGDSPKTPPEEPPGAPRRFRGDAWITPLPPPPVGVMDIPVGILLVRDDDLWVPEYGNQTTVTTQIYEKPPGSAHWVLSNKRRTHVVTFSDRSRELGWCLNFSVPPAPATPDLYLPQARNPDARCYEEDSGTGYLFRTSETLRKVSRHTFTVGSEDYGSFSKMAAFCKEGDCAILHRQPDGTVREAAGNEERIVRVPKDDNDNQIADGYLPEMLFSPPATQDEDPSPIGNRVPGDGLSAYEEYRGFYVKGAHVRTVWADKDLFVYNQDNLPMVKFAASQLAVHEIEQSEYDGARVVNFNRGHATLVAEHGLHLLNEDLGPKTLGRSEGFGPPKNVNSVKIHAAHPTHAASADELQSTVAHELGHGVGMRHHGDLPSPVTQTVYPPSAGWIRRLFSYVHPWPTICGGIVLPRDLSVGQKHNQASGMVPCLMRYNYWGRLYPQANGQLDCIPHPEPQQTTFCASPAGTVFNSGDSCAGTASVGNCKGQIIVNDRS